MSLLDTASLIVTPNGYKEGKLYSVIPSDGSGDLSVTRATTATRVNSAGLVELVPYNLVQYSEDFSNGAWITNNATITSNATTAPNGTTTAEKIAEDNSNTDHKTRQTITYASGSYTWSVYAKANERTFAVINVYDGTNLFGYTFNLSNGTLGSAVSGSGSVTANIQDASNGWYRCSITFNATSGTGQANVGTALNATTTSYTGTTGSGIYIWGAQLVEGSTALPYQKTETRLNIPRLDYSNGTCPSILVEPQRTNRLFYSERLVLGYAFAYTSGTFTVTENTTETLDPFGNYNAEKFNATTQSNNDSYTSTSGSGNLTLSIFAKKGTNDSIQLYHDNVLSGGAFAATFNLTSGTITASSGTASIQDLGNGWFRCSVSGTDSNSAGNIHGVTTYTGTTYLFGIQLEQGNYVTSYIPTTNSSVTRNADVISKTGISSLIGQTEGSFFYDFVYKGQKEAVICEISNAIGNSVLNLYITSSGNVQSYLFDLSTQVGFINSSFSPTINTRYRIAIGYKLNDLNIYVNGSSIGTDTPVTIPSFSEIYIGRDKAGLYPTFENVNAVALWKTRLTNAQLATLTTI